MKKVSTKHELGKRRLRAGLKVQDVADCIVNPATGRKVRAMSVFRWEWGTSTPSPILLERWTRALDRLERDKP